MPKATFSAEKSKWIISLGTITYCAQGTLFCFEIQDYGGHGKATLYVEKSKKNCSLGTVSNGAQGYLFYREISENY